jgi:predicted transcriptional regulator
MSSGSLIRSSRRVEKGSKSVDGSGKVVSQVESSDALNVKLIEYMAKLRDEVVRGITVRFPIKGMDTVVRQVFDSTLEKSFDSLTCALNFEPKHSLIADDASKVPCFPAVNKYQNLDSQGKIHSQIKINGSKKVEPSAGTLKILEDTCDTQSVLEKAGKIDAKVVKDYQKRIDELMFAIKTRDRKILDQKKEIEKLQNSLNLLEKQVNSPFISPSAHNPEEEIQIQKQMQSLMEFMKRITPILNRDPKYKIMFFLKRIGKSDINKLSEELGIPPKKLNTLLRELETMKIIRREEDNVYLIDVH